MQFATIFQNHAVLQRNLPIPIWGLGEPGELVRIQLADHEGQVLVDDRGYWLLRLPPLPAGGPHKLIAEAPSGRAETSDILVGDVWLCSGQSNMEWSLQQCGPDWMTDSPAIPEIRFLSVTTPASLGKTSAVAGVWTPCTPASLAGFSAVGGFFGREIHRELNVPIGLINNAWGGSRVQAWISREALMQDPSGRDEVGFYESFITESKRAVRIKSFAEWEATDAPQDVNNLGIERGWADPGFDDSSWTTMALPGHWNKQGHPYNGIFWFRRTVEIPEIWAGQDLQLSLGAIDKHDHTWVNGELVGSMGFETPNAWSTHRNYPVPARLIGPDRRVTIAVRARSHVNDGGMTGPASLMKLQCFSDVSAPLSLSGDWRYHVEQDWGQVRPPDLEWGAGNQNSPHILFDSRLSPLIPYGLRGVIWYQGESNASEAPLYRRMLPLMIQDWRRAWGQGDFPFLQVQLANYGEPVQHPGSSSWAELREAQLDVLKEPVTGMAVAVDIGEAFDVHPKNKRDVGLRLARWALAETYGRGGTPSGPLFSGMRIETGGRLVCSFLHAGNGLKGEKLRHFAIAGSDRVFKWAEAEIVGSTVEVWSKSVPEPMAVRYAWADNPDGCNLYNKEGLPASPFRSDSWLV